MAANNFLVVGITPANSESNVDINTPIVIKFSKYMNASTVNLTNIVFRKINGDKVDATLVYDSNTLTATITPKSVLEFATQYEIFIAGGQQALLGITNDYLPESKTYRFTTTFNVSITEPQEVATSVDSGFTTVTWKAPAQYDVDLPVSYEVAVSTSNDPKNPFIWPSTGDINKVNSLVLTIPKRFPEGNYYVYVRAMDNYSTSEWASAQFAVEKAAVVTPTTPTETETPSTGGVGNTDIFSFDVSETYPKRDQVDVTPEKVLILFSSNVDMASVTKDSVYIIKKANKATLGSIDFMTDYASSKAVSATIDTSLAPNMVAITASLEDDSEYTVIVRESVRNTGGASLGVAYHWSFITHYTQLYGDPEAVRQDIGSISDDVTDKVLFKYLSESSQYAYQIVSGTDVFDEADYVDGAAPYYVHQYVRLRTAYDLVLNSQLRRTGSTITDNTSTIKLGTLTVTKDLGAGATTTVSVSGILSALKDKMKPFEDMMHGHHNRGYAKPQVVVRGENVETYPDFFTRDEFKELGE